MDNLIVSIVSGTYNRLPQLKAMVESARQSIGIGLLYEIVIVDGGSNDGTQNWCKSQPDIVLIEQGKLLGAVKAFNAGAQAARGTYVILANDDITFIDESIMASIAYMQDHNGCGIGCFYQDRDGLDFYVDSMPAVIDGKQSNVHYGQVCIVPRWLGNQVGWWGNYLHTYAGDNELSCNILEAGYTVDPLPCSCIHDGKHNDDLRKTNSKLDKNGRHPDSVAWTKKWRHKDGTFGPIIRSYYVIKDSPVTYTERLLHAPIYEPYYRDLQFRTRKGIRAALSKRFLVTEVDYVQNPMLLFDVANAWNPDIILTQFHNNEPWNAAMVAQLRLEHPNAVLVNWNGDYFASQFFNASYMAMMKMYDYCGFVATTMQERYEKAGIHYFYWQIGFEPSDVKPDSSTPHHDVLFLANFHRADPIREQVGMLLNRMTSLNVGIYGSWPKSIRSRGSNLYDFDAGRKLYMACKIAVSDTRKGADAWVSNRFFEALAGGAFLLQQRVPRLDEMNGCIDGIHYVSWTDINDLKDKIGYWMAHDTEREAIAKAGKDWAETHCSFEHRIQELCKRLGI